MAKKLVIDRPIELKNLGARSAVVPQDEVWKVSSSVPVSGEPMDTFIFQPANSSVYILAGGCRISGGVYITGIAFKIVGV